jgi:Outer membrane protein transport protein (OMPP1/FadL/TodX).
MKNIVYILFLVSVCQPLTAQLPEDALRMGWNIPGGTARQQAIGGAMGSLGGDISSMFVNPAGLGFYKTSEMVLTPGFSFSRSNSNYRETDARSEVMSRFNIGASGFVFGNSNTYSKWTSKAFAIGINRTANFNSSVYYKGENSLSSYSEAFAEELAASQIDIGDFQNSDLSIGTKLAIESYLIDTMTLNGETQVIGLPEFLSSVNQENRITTTGGITEIALAFANNMNDNLYIGGAIGIPILNYNRTTEYLETDPTNDNDNNFNYSRYIEDFSSRGVGVNVKLGLIFKPQPSWRVGLAVHSPTIYGIRDKLSARMITDAENYVAPNYGAIDASTIDAARYKYDLVSPWRFLASGSYVIGEVADVSRQRGFITADVEYVTYGSPRFSASDAYEDDSYFKDVNNVVKNSYKGAFNFKVGGEMKFNTLMTRLGVAYYTNPYRDADLNGNKMNLSGGLGYRNRGIFLDLTYVQSLNNDVHFPYRLTDKPNTFAEIKDRSGYLVMTLGFKL